MPYRLQCSRNYASPTGEIRVPEIGFNDAESLVELKKVERESVTELTYDDEEEEEKASLKPPSSHESPSLLYDPVAR